MKRIVLLVFVFLACLRPAIADHITGGEIYYAFGGMVNGEYSYRVTVKLFMRCHSGREFNDPAIIAIFNSAGDRIRDVSVPIQRVEQLHMDNTNPCITNPPEVCFHVAYYQFETTLPPSGTGYTITAQVVFRIDGINNLTPNYNQVGATFTGTIPGNATVPNGPVNNSAHFIGSDMVVVCSSNAFSYSFGATDEDGDQLRYSFCDAYQTLGVRANDDSPPPHPPYSSVPYGNGFTGSAPLGKDVQIESSTGLITGIAPANGVYVVTVCVEEIRNGVVIATQRKDLQISVASCDIASAGLPDEFMLCSDSRTLQAKNLSTSNLIKTYNWEITDEDGNRVFESADPQISYDFNDVGVYDLKLVINRSDLCADSVNSKIIFFPGFAPDFSFEGSCISNPVRFTDATTTVTGTVNRWEWDFGDVSNADSSTQPNPSFTFASRGNKTVRLITANSDGCRDTITKIVEVIDKPAIDLSFNDTLICPPDALVLSAQGNGNFTWRPQTQITGPATNSPTVAPLSTTMYYVDLDLDGCLNTDSVLVRVVNEVSLQAMADTIICLGDAAQLHTVSNGLKFSWTHAEDLDNAASPNPVAKPAFNTAYEVTASISSCTATADIAVTAVPYPVAAAGQDTMICFNTAAQLKASTDGSSFRWAPATGLTDSNQLDPVVRPNRSTSYILYAFDTRGCPKPGIDTVTVMVLDKLAPFAGNDTTAVVNQPLQLSASGGTRYLWSPSQQLSAENIPNPVALFASVSANRVFPFKVMVYNEAGCEDSAFVNVEVFSSAPDIFVPSAFTPNGDGLNDFFKPVSAGIARVDFFRVYNRWGQLVYDSQISAHSLGWDGSVNGKRQASGTFVWMLRAMDYTGKAVIKRGTVALIR